MYDIQESVQDNAQDDLWRKRFEQIWPAVYDYEQYAYLCVPNIRKAGENKHGARAWNEAASAQEQPH